jgi:DNA-binding NarL/FixJ family response regulator
MSDSNAGRDRIPRLTNVLSIDDDPIFRLGLRTALESFPDLQVVAQADTGTAALELLRTLQGEDAVDLVILELALDQSNPNDLSGLALCQQLKADYPNLPVLLLTGESEPAQLVAAQESGIEGYCPKGCPIAQIVQAIRQLVAGQSFWSPLPTPLTTPTSAVRPPSWHLKLRQSSLRQIEDELARVRQQLQNPNLSNLDWLFWSGRRRELLAARWVVNQLLPTDVIVVEQENKSVGELPPSPPSGRRAISSSSQSPIRDRMGRDADRNRQMPLAALPNPTSDLSQALHPSTPFDVTLTKLQSGLSNLTGVVLEIDILAAEKKRDLLYTVLRKFEEILDELRFSQVIIEQLPEKRSLILQDLWQASLIDFFGKYYTLTVGNQHFEVVRVLLSYAEVIQETILDKIPLVVELLGHQLFEAPLVIDNVSYPAQTPEARVRGEMLLQNLIIQVANAIIQPFLNEFSDIETIKQEFYDRHLMSSREIARFRNNLSWRYRISQVVLEPKAIFESRYDLFVMSSIGIKQTSIYASRRQELDRLRGIPLAVTLAYEMRDAIAPRLRAIVAWGGRGVVYVLTQVLGRAIGLVIRGVIQGIGNALQDTRFGKNGERGK